MCIQVPWPRPPLPVPGLQDTPPEVEAEFKKAADIQEQHGRQRALGPVLREAEEQRAVLQRAALHAATAWYGSPSIRPARLAG